MGNQFVKKMNRLQIGCIWLGATVAALLLFSMIPSIGELVDARRSFRNTMQVYMQFQNLVIDPDGRRSFLKTSEEYRKESGKAWNRIFILSGTLFLVLSFTGLGVYLCDDKNKGVKV